MSSTDSIFKLEGIRAIHIQRLHAPPDTLFRHYLGGVFLDKETVLHGHGSGIDPHPDGFVGIGMYRDIGVPGLGHIANRLRLFECIFRDIERVVEGAYAASSHGLDLAGAHAQDFPGALDHLRHAIR